MKNTNWLCLMVLIFSTSVSAEQQTLALDTVVNSALQAFPSLLATEQRIVASEGEYTAAEGGFDTLLKSQNRWSVAGVYENQNNDVVLEQPTQFGGTTFFGGWRRGSGKYPDYEGKSLTADDGEVRIGVNIPLWRNRDIDRRRATLKQADIGQSIASQDYDQMLLDVQRQAAHRYWDWVLAGQRLRITEQMLQIAEQRNNAIQERAAAGDIAQFEVLDNQRAIIERRERQVAAKRLLEQSAIQRSLYWRDKHGEPQLPESPTEQPKITESYDEAVNIAMHQRPELKRLTAQSEQQKTELELQENQANPAVDVSVSTAQDVGPNPYDKINKPNRNEVYVGLNIDIPLQRRVATGRAQVASANVQRLKWETQSIENRITAEVKDVLSQLTATKKRLALSQEQQQAAQKLEEGEHERFDLGDSTLLVVNLRAIAHGDAQLQVAESTNNLFKAHADYQAILAKFAVKPEQIQKSL
ncbi:MAG: TolC family protein [Methylococcales bacterium]|nr:TolC family protein [Methylococcales bacterium]